MSLPSRFAPRLRPLHAATLLALATMAGLANAADAPATTDEATLPTVVVTGEKIDRHQKDTPTAVTVFQASKVNDGARHDIVELQQEVPNTTRNAAGNINIRGVDGNGPVTGGVALMTGSRARVSTSVDGVNDTWSGQQYLNIGLWDVEQVEVLRGPQSTIQGRNAIGGAVVTKTKDPTFDWEGAARVGGENRGGRGYLAAAVSGPIVADKLAFRLAVDGMKGEGFIKYEGSYPYDPSEVQNGSVRGKLLWQLNDRLQAKLTLQHREYKGEYLNRIEALCDTASCANLSSLFADYKFRNLISNTRRQDSKSDNANIDVDLRFTDALSGHLLYSHGQDKLHFDESGSDRFSMSQDQKNNTFESRVVYDPKNGSISGVAGVYYYDRDQDLLVGNTNPSSVTFTGTDRVQTVAAYGEATVGLAKHIDLIAGARVERENQKRNLDAWPGMPWGGKINTDIGETMFLPKLGVQYKLPSTTLGLTARKGYNPGAGSLDWNNSVFYEYGKEEVLTYELTSRSLLLDDSLSLNATAFYNDYKGYQAFDGRRVTNIAKAISSGLELEAAAKVTRSFDLYGSIGLLSTEVKQGGNSITGNTFVGNDLNGAPSFTANIGFKHKVAGHWYWSGNASYTGEYYSAIDNNQNEKAGDYWTVNLQGGYDAGRFAVRAYVKNLFNADVMYSKDVSTSGGLPAVVSDVGAPRTAGFVVDVRF